MEKINKEMLEGMYPIGFTLTLNKYYDPNGLFPGEWKITTNTPINAPDTKNWIRVA